MAISVTGLTVHTQTGAGTWDDVGGGGGSGETTAAFISSTSARGRKFSGVKGMLFQVNAAGTDLSNSIIVIRYLLNGGYGSTLAAGGGYIRLQDTSGNTSDYYVAGSDTYTGGWVIVVVDTANTPSATAGGGATLTAVQYAGYVVDAAGSSGDDDNFYIDEVLSLPNTGLTLAGNTTALFDEAAAFDESSLYGIITKTGPVIFTKCPLILSPDASDHVSTDEILVFEEPFYNDGTNVDSALTLQGLASADTDTITLTRLTAICENNSDVVGTNADKELDFASATDIVATNCVFRGFDGTTFALGGSGNDYTGCTFQACQQVTDTGAVIRQCVFRNTINADGAYGWTTSADIEDCTFESDGSGHGIDFISAPVSPLTTAFTDIVAVGYGADNTANAFTDNNTGNNIIIDLLGTTTGITVNTTTNTTTQQTAAINITGVTQGTSLIVIAAETVGTVTDGDILNTQFADSNGEATYNLPYETAFDPSGLDITIKARNQGIAVAAIAENGPVFTDETAEASSNSTADMTLLPTGGAAINDAYYFAHNEEFSRLKLDISTAFAGTFLIIVWEYWNGSAWTALSGVSDGTNGLLNTGPNIVSWTIPGDWATTTVFDQGPLYYVRYRVTVVSGQTTDPLGRKCTLDVTRYLPYRRARTVTATGITDVASWQQDAVSQF